jgi:hypothetical protein
MQSTFIVKNLTDSTLASLQAMEPRAAYDKLHRWSYGDLRHCVSLKVGSGAFRDRVDWNTRMKAGAPLSFKVEPRRGYKLFTFTA